MSLASTSLHQTHLDRRFRFKRDHTTYEIAWTSLGNSEGIPVVLLHGIPWSSRLWAPIAAALAATNRYHVYLFDNPGYGETLVHSDKPDCEPDISPEAKAACFAAITEFWKLKQQPHVIAHDRGGQIALRGALIHGLEYASLCMADVVATNPLGAPFLILIRDNPDVFRQLAPEIFENMVRAWVRTATADGKGRLNGDDENILMLPWLKIQGQEAFIRQAIQTHANLVEDLETRYHELRGKIPIKVIWGQNDVWLPVERAEKIGRMVGAKEIVLIEDAGHLIQLDQPERLAVELVTWLQSVSN